MPAHDVHYDLAADPAALDRGDRPAVRRGAGRAGRRARSSSRPALQRRARPRTRRASTRPPVLEPARSARRRGAPRRSSASASCASARTASSSPRRRALDRARAEGGRRRPAGAAAGADRARAGARAVGGRRRAPARRGPAEDRCGSITPTRRALDELPEPPGPVRMYVCGPTVYARAHIGNARPFVLGMWLRSWLRERRVRRDARPQHHRHQRQDLRGGARRQRGAGRAGDRSGTSRTPAPSASAGPTTCRRRARSSPRSSRSSSS